MREPVVVWETCVVEKRRKEGPGGFLGNNPVHTHQTVGGVGEDRERPHWSWGKEMDFGGRWEGGWQAWWGGRSAWSWGRPKTHTGWLVGFPNFLSGLSRGQVQ